MLDKNDTNLIINDIYESNSINYIETVPVRYQHEQSNTIINIIGVYFKKNDLLKLPIYSGRNLNEDDIFSNKKVAIVGTLLQKFIETENGTNYINIKGERYKVLGIVGGENHSYFNNFIFIPLKQMPKFYLFEQIIQSSFFTLDSENQENLKKLKEDSKNIQFIDLRETIKSNAIANTFFYNKDKFKSISLDLFMSTISIFVFSSIWIRGLYKTLCLNRLLGATTKNILVKIFTHISILSFISLLSVLIIQLIFKENILNTMFYKYDYFLQLDLSATNIILAICFLTIVALLNSVIQVRKILSLDIISNLK